MGMGARKRRELQEQLWVTHTELANGPGHPFYAQLNSLLGPRPLERYHVFELPTSRSPVEVQSIFNLAIFAHPPKRSNYL